MNGVKCDRASCRMANVEPRACCVLWKESDAFFGSKIHFFHYGTLFLVFRRTWRLEMLRVWVLTFEEREREWKFLSSRTLGLEIALQGTNGSIAIFILLVNAHIVV
jgi:hypothetical protein